MDLPVPDSPVIRAVAFSLLYLLIYYVVLRRFKIDEVELLSDRLAGKLRSVMRSRIGERSAGTRER